MTVHEETRNIYHAQHVRINKDDTAMRRFLGMWSEEYFHLPAGWFQGKKVLDAGCGDTMKTIIKFHDFGSRDITGLDVGSEFIPVARKNLQKYKADDGSVRLVSGNVLELPFPDNSFDFVCCNGVLIHLANHGEVQTALSELARVTKDGGYLYISLGLYSGLLEEAVYPAVREYYRTNRDFARFIDTISPEAFRKVLVAMKQGLKVHSDEEWDIEPLRSLLDVDLCVTIQNVIQVPVRLKISPQLMQLFYKRYKFTNVKLCRRYVKRKNIRKYFSPLHFDWENPVTQMLYGLGSLDYVACKAGHPPLA